MSNRNNQIDTLRGMACLLLVSYHVIGANSLVGLRVEEGALRDVHDYLGYIRMPLFTFLSGIVYAYRPFSSGAVNYLKGKSRRLLVPMLFVGTIFAVLQSLVPGTNSGIETWYLLHIKPVAHFWFIESIFIIFVLLVPLEVLKVFNSKLGWLCVFLSASVLYVSDFYYVYFSVSGAIYLFPFFLMGMFVQRYDFFNKIKHYKWILILLLLSIIVLIYNDHLSLVASRSPVGLAIGTVSCLLLFAIKPSFTPLARIGTYSYSIYLLHVFFTAFSRIALTKIGINELVIVYSISLVLGLLGPIIADIIIDKHKLCRLVLLGKS
jgi:peptidoglycan/LPS O-acetylase OafA/YrhL